MRYFIFNLEKTPEYHCSGKSVNERPLRHQQRTLADFELFYVTDGKLCIRQNEEYCVQKGEVLLHNKGEWQGGTRAEPTTFYWFHFDGEVFLKETEAEAKALCEGKEKWIFFSEYFALHNADRISLMLTELNHYLFEGDDKLVKDHLTAALLAELARQYAQSIDYVTDKRFGEILGYLSLNLASDISIAELARRFSYNPKYLSGLFRKFTGKTAKEYITEKRMEAAKRMLVLGNEPIKFIARAVGYEDEYYFMRVFKAFTGVSPKTYRKTFCGCNYT